MSNNTEATIRIMLSALKMARSQSENDRRSPLDGSMLPKETSDELVDDAIERGTEYLAANNMTEHAPITAKPTQYKSHEFQYNYIDKDNIGELE